MSKWIKVGEWVEVTYNPDYEIVTGEYLGFCERTLSHAVRNSQGVIIQFKDYVYIQQDK